MWVIRVFDKQTEMLVRDVPVAPALPLDRLRPIWDVPDEDPMYDSYSVRESEAAAISDFVKIEYDFEAHDYFLEQVGLRESKLSEGASDA